MNKIKVLSNETINKIAAGEVVERPASVVKELVENSIDAGAAYIEVEVNSGGKNLIGVTDDGCGMDKDDAVLAFERHATSKIRSADDLFHVYSLGFRGEALPSIASISKVELVTRTKEMDSAIRIRVEGGKLLEIKETGAPAGTSVTVKNLFYNTPARRKFLKTNTTELSHIVNIVSQYSIMYANCGFKLIHNEESIIEISPKDSLLDRIRILYGNEIAEGVLGVNTERDGIKVKGYCSQPAITHQNRSNQFVFINKRPIVNRAISYGVYESYVSLIPKGRYPAVFLFLEISPESIDVNVHPTKKEVKFGDDRVVQGVVRESVLNALGVKENVGAESEIKDSAYVNRGGGAHAFAYTHIPFLKSQNTWNIMEPASTLDKVSGRKIAQILNSYIIAESDDGFEIIDQHAVHERILYEKIKSQLRKKVQEGQRLLIPVNVELNPGEDGLLREGHSFFAELGFSIEEFGGRTVIVDMIPSYLDKVDIAKFIKDILSDIKENEGGAAAKNKSHFVYSDNIKDAIIKAIACRAAVKQGDKLENVEIQKLLAEWAQLEFPYTCPHGRPAVIKMEKRELDKKFKRT